jgi:hypothetical protein
MRALRFFISPYRSLRGKHNPNCRNTDVRLPISDKLGARPLYNIRRSGRRGKIIMSVVRGRCLCGGVEFGVTGPLRPVVYCHCKMCRRSSGHFVAATACAVPHLSIDRSETLRWYASSGVAARGFCGVCGSNLFWKPASGTHVSIMAGTLEDPTGLKAAAHIFVSAKGDYYSLEDGLARHGDGAHGIPLATA